MIAKLHSASGLALLLYVVWHLWETAVAPEGRRVFAARLTGADASSRAVVLEALLVGLPLLIHIVLGIWIMARSPRRDRPVAYEAPLSRTAQRVTGLLALAFLAVHLGHTWAVKIGGRDVAFVYDRLRGELGTPVYLAIYAVGMTCLCFHLGQGLCVASQTWGVIRTDGGRRAFRVVVAALAALLWLLSVDTAAHFATGSGWLREPTASSVAPVAAP